MGIVLTQRGLSLKDELLCPPFNLVHDRCSRSALGGALVAAEESVADLEHVVHIIAKAVEAGKHVTDGVGQAIRSSNNTRKAVELRDDCVVFSFLGNGGSHVGVLKIWDKIVNGISSFVIKDRDKLASPAMVSGEKHIQIGGSLTIKTTSQGKVKPRGINPRELDSDRLTVNGPGEAFHRLDAVWMVGVP